MLFPLEGLDVSPFTLNGAGPTVYDLCAVSNHFGGVGGGHYNTCAGSEHDGDWCAPAYLQPLLVLKRRP